MAHHFYVYYRVRPSAVDAARAALGRMQLELARSAGVTGRVVVRCDEPELWMEIYENVPDPRGFETALAVLSRDCGLDAQLVEGSGRTVECFRD